MKDLSSVPIQQCMNFSQYGRCVNWVYNSSAADVLVVCWEPGQSSSYHEHGPSESIVYVVEGVVTVTSGDEQRRYEAGTLVITPRGVKHKLWNAEQVRLVTLHVYSPRLATSVSQPVVDLRTGKARNA